MKQGLLACGVLLQAGCAGYYDDALRDRAAFELSCPREQLALQELGGPFTKGVTGCGNKAVYVLTSNAQWVLNSDSKSAEKKPSE